MAIQQISTTEDNESRKPVVFRNLASDIPSTTYATFGLYKYPAKFIPQVIAYALKSYATEEMSVFDPFAGYGTVGTVARLYGNSYELWDLNPLLDYLHPISIMKPIQLDVDSFMQQMVTHQLTYEPDWSNVGYWYPPEFLSMLCKAWGFYHILADETLKKVLLIPLIKATRYFSYNDEKRQKLSRSPLIDKRVGKLLAQDWREIFYEKITVGINQILTRLEQYHELNPKQVDMQIRSGVDGLNTKLTNNHDILITSPPYLQAQEYIRASKMDLFWLGYSETFIKELSKKEFPYQNAPRIPIHSSTYSQCLKDIKEEHMARLFERYFFGVLGTLTHLQEKISRYLLLFLGSATVRTKPIPIDQIFTEHFTSLGWKHEVTLVDTIVARAMFFYRLNPATGKKDNRMPTEHLVVLSKK